MRGELRRDLEPPSGWARSLWSFRVIADLIALVEEFSCLFRIDRDAAPAERVGHEGEVSLLARLGLRAGAGP